MNFQTPRYELLSINIGDGCVILSETCLSAARGKNTAKIHFSAEIVTECAHDIIERVSWHHWKLSSYACQRNSVNFMMEEWTENPRTTLIKHGKMSFDADFRDNLIESWFEAEMLSTNTFLHEAGNKKLFFFMSHHTMFLCLRLTSGQTSSRNICLKSVLSIPIARASITVMWIYDYTQGTKNSKNFHSSFFCDLYGNAFVKQLTENYSRWLFVDSWPRLSADPTQFIDSYIKIISYQKWQVESGRLHLMQGKKTQRGERKLEWVFWEG